MKMDFPKYDGNIHPDEWINDIQKYFKLRKINVDYLEIAISLVDTTISLPNEIDSFEKLRNALKEDISFTIFKNSNKRKLQSLKYISESKGGDTSKFISTFRKFCYNAEINDIEEQKKYLYKSLPMNHFDCISDEFYEKMKNVKSINELIKEFEEFVAGESQLITNESTVALKHIATGKYLSSIRSLNYTTGSKQQLVFVGSPEPGPNSLWKIQFKNELATYNNTLIALQHVKSNKFLGRYYCSGSYYDNNGNYLYNSCFHKSPLTKHTEVSCYGNGSNWKFKHSKLENYQGYLKSNDIINLHFVNVNEFLRSHNIQFTIGNDSFQEVFCHNERLGGNDEWCIELIN